MEEMKMNTVPPVVLEQLRPTLIPPKSPDFPPAAREWANRRGLWLVGDVPNCLHGAAWAWCPGACRSMAPLDHAQWWYDGGVGLFLLAHEYGWGDAEQKRAGDYAGAHGATLSVPPWDGWYAPSATPVCYDYGDVRATPLLPLLIAMSQMYPTEFTQEDEPVSGASVSGEHLRPEASHQSGSVGRTA